MLQWIFLLMFASFLFFKFIYKRDLKTTSAISIISKYTRIICVIVFACVSTFVFYSVNTGGNIDFMFTHINYILPISYCVCTIALWDV